MARRKADTIQYEAPARHLRNPYVSGSAAPRFAPKEFQENFVSPRERAEQERIEKEARRKARRRQNYMRANRISTAYMVMAVALACAILYSYVRLQSNITISLKQISVMQNKLEAVRAENDATQKRLATAVSLEDIKTDVTENLGMRYATDSQIIYFEVENTDFMSQYSDLP